MDTLSKQRRSWNMSRIRGKNTKPELTVRSLMHRMGYRFRLHSKDLPGEPDIVMKKYNTVIFVNGCFWHRHMNCKYAYTPKTRKNFWRNKFLKNIRRDKFVRNSLQALGWNVLTIWECQTKDHESLSTILNNFFNCLLSRTYNEKS